MFTQYQEHSSKSSGYTSLLDIQKFFLNAQTPGIGALGLDNIPLMRSCVDQNRKVIKYQLSTAANNKWHPAFIRQAALFNMTAVFPSFFASGYDMLPIL